MKKIKIFIATLFIGITLFLTSCNNNKKYVLEVKQNDNELTIVYSDGTEEKIVVKGEKGEQGPVGEKGEQGPAGEKGNDGLNGEPAEKIEFRYYRGILWWRYVSSNTWTALVTTEELNIENLSIEDFKMSIYVKEDDLSLTINNDLKVNGEWTNYEIQGNTLTFSVTKDEKTKYYDITKKDDQFTMISYFESGVNEQNVEFVNNKDYKDFNGTYTYQTEDNQLYKVAINATDDYVTTNISFGETNIYCSTYVKGEVLFAKQSFGGDAEITLESKVNGYNATLKLADGTIKNVTSVTKWVDIANFICGYTIDVDNTTKVDVVIKNASMMDFYTNADQMNTYFAPNVVQNENSMSLTIDENKYEFIWDETEQAVMVKVNDAIKPYTKWNDVKVFNGNATFKNDDQTVNFNIQVTESTFGTYISVTSSLDGYWNATQYRNNLYISYTDWSTGTENKTVYILTLNEDNTFSGSHNDKEYTIIRAYELKDFAGKYQCQKNADSGALLFEVKLNPITNEYYLEYMGNQTNCTIEDNVLVFRNNRQGAQFELIKNTNGTYSFREKNFEDDDAEYVVYEIVNCVEE